jgi:hypothetical protein
MAENQNGRAPAERLDAEQCRKNADECREQALASKDPSHRIMLDHMAETWERIGRTFGAGR